MPAPVLSLRGVAHRYAGRTALAPLHLDLDPGSRIVVLGPNGSGKSTLLRIAAGLLRPTSGTRHCDVVSVLLAPGSGARRRQRVVDAVTSAAAVAGHPMDPAGAERALATVGLPEQVWKQRVGQLSSGQHARLSLGLALVVPAGLVCLDEPSAHVDAEGAAAVGVVADELARAGRTLLVATHDPVVAGLPADARLELTDGRVGFAG